MSHFSIAGLQLELSAQDNLHIDPQRDWCGSSSDFPGSTWPCSAELSLFGTRQGTPSRCRGPSSRTLCQIARELDALADPGFALRARRRSHLQHHAGDQPARRGGRAVPQDVSVPAVRVGRHARRGIRRLRRARRRPLRRVDLLRHVVSRDHADAGLDGRRGHPASDLTNTIDRDLELAIARTNAAVNQCYFFDINCAGRLGYGRSIVVGPDGNVLHQAGSGHEIIPVEIDLEHVRRSRRRGLLGLGQVLKSFRDTEVQFPPYRDGRGLAGPGEPWAAARTRSAPWRET